MQIPITQNRLNPKKNVVVFGFDFTITVLHLNSFLNFNELFGKCSLPLPENAQVILKKAFSSNQPTPQTQKLLVDYFLSGEQRFSDLQCLFERLSAHSELRIVSRGNVDQIKNFLRWVDLERYFSSITGSEVPKDSSILQLLAVNRTVVYVDDNPEAHLALFKQHAGKPLLDQYFFCKGCQENSVGMTTEIMAEVEQAARKFVETSAHPIVAAAAAASPATFPHSSLRS